MNMISGYTVGNWLIGPGVLISGEFRYYLWFRQLTIVPEPLTVTAKDTVAGCNGIQPLYSLADSIYQYDDADSNVVAPWTCFYGVEQCWSATLVPVISPLALIGSYLPG